MRAYKLKIWGKTRIIFPIIFARIFGENFPVNAHGENYGFFVKIPVFHAGLDTWTSRLSKTFVIDTSRRSLLFCWWLVCASPGYIALSSTLEHYAFQRFGCSNLYEAAGSRT